MAFSKKVGNASRQTALTDMRATTETAKPVIFTGGIMLKNSHMCVESLNIAGLLHSIGLTKYAIHFQAEEVEMATLKQMGDSDLTELGLPLGPRKKILLALKLAENSNGHNCEGLHRKEDFWSLYLWEHMSRI